MTALPDELRLLIFVAVQAFILLACWKFVSRFVASRLQRAIDALLLAYLIQYVAVGLPGLIGLLSPTSMLATAGVIAVGLLASLPKFYSRYTAEGRIEYMPSSEESRGEEPVSNRKPVRQSKQNPPPDVLPAYGEKGPYILLAGALFVLGYVAAYVWQQRYLPPMATDALTYHFPAAVQWLQHGRIDLFQTWFFNPANTYSPLAGSMFYAWLLGPIGNDTLAHLAPAPMVFLIFLAVAGLVRSMAIAGDLAPYEFRLSVPGATLTAVLAGLAVALSRPIVGQIDKGKDDLFLAAFFVVAVGALSPNRLRDPLGPWRIGVAIGLALAVKYTSLLALPMLVLAIDAPFRAGWRWKQWLIAGGCVLAIAGPWYLRNVFLTGNPLFPTGFVGMHGLLSTTRSFELRTFAGVMGVLNSGPFAISGALGVLLLFAWATAITTNARRTKSDPLARLVAVGPVVGMAIFVFSSPYPEIRFILPEMILVAACVGRIGTFGLLLAFAAAIAAIATGLDSQLWRTLLDFCLAGAMFAAIGMALFHLHARWRRLRRDPTLGVITIVALLLAGYAYVNWTAFVNERQSSADVAWGVKFQSGKLWDFVRNQLPPGEPIAYTGTFTVYPLMGFHLDRPVTYVPVQAGVKSIADLPRLDDGGPLTGEQIQIEILRVTSKGADQAAWLKKLRASGAKHFVAFTNDIEKPPVEYGWAISLPRQFQKEYEDESGAVFRVVGP